MLPRSDCAEARAGPLTAAGLSQPPRPITLSRSPCAQQVEGSTTYQQCLGRIATLFPGRPHRSTRARVCSDLGEAAPAAHDCDAGRECGSSVGDDVEVDGELHVGVELYLHGMRADRLD